jgi:hypothetical protein
MPPPPLPHAAQGTTEVTVVVVVVVMVKLMTELDVTTSVTVTDAPAVDVARTVEVLAVPTPWVVATVVVTNEEGAFPLCPMI